MKASVAAHVLGENTIMAYQRREFERRLIAQGLVSIALIDRGESRELALESAARIFMPPGLDPTSVEEIPEYEQPFAILTPSFALAWAECGFPKIEPSHRLAASLMATTMPDDLVDDLVLPWRCFAIVVPSGLLSIDEHMIIVLRSHVGDFKVLGIMPSGFHFGVEPRLSGLASKLIHRRNEMSPPPDGFNVRLAWRESELAMRLSLGVIAEIGEHRPSIRPSVADVRNVIAKGPDGFKARTFKLTRSVTVDVRNEIANYATGKTDRVVTVRSLVRGHWKQQPHGQERTQRKLIHIEPYWRGDESLPIAVKSHAIDSDYPIIVDAPDVAQHIYFVQAGVNGPIKVGFASDVESRLRSLQTGNAARMSLLGSVVVVDARKTEHEVHATLSDLRLEGEWFANDPRVIAELVRLRSLSLEER